MLVKWCNSILLSRRGEDGVIFWANRHLFRSKLFFELYRLKFDFFPCKRLSKPSIRMWMSKAYNLACFWWWSCCRCIAYLFSCHRTSSDAKFWTIRTTFYCNYNFVIGEYLILSYILFYLILYLDCQITITPSRSWRLSLWPLLLGRELPPEMKPWQRYWFSGSIFGFWLLASVVWGATDCRMSQTTSQPRTNLRLT